MRNKCKLHHWSISEVLHLSLVHEDNIADDDDDDIMMIIIKVCILIFHAVLPILSCYKVLCVC